MIAPDGKMKIRTFYLNIETDRFDYESIFNETDKYGFVKEIFAYDRSGRPISTVWYLEFVQVAVASSASSLFSSDPLID